MNQQDLEKLSTKEIKALWKATTDKAHEIQAKKTEAAAITDVTGDDGDEYYLDGFGNVIPGLRPPTKTVRTYVDASGYVQELAESEEPPQLSGSGLVDWLNQQDISADPELREALGADNLFFDEQYNRGRWRFLNGDWSRMVGTWFRAERHGRLILNSDWAAVLLVNRQSNRPPVTSNRNLVHGLDS